MMGTRAGTCQPVGTVPDDGTIRGCVWAAVQELERSHGMPDTPRLRAEVEWVYRQHRTELAPLAGDDRLWRHLAQLRLAYADDLALF